jgi:hypothetical protein
MGMRWEPPEQSAGGYGSSPPLYRPRHAARPRLLRALHRSPRARLPVPAPDLAPLPPLPRPDPAGRVWAAALPVGRARLNYQAQRRRFLSAGGPARDQLPVVTR